MYGGEEMTEHFALVLFFVISHLLVKYNVHFTLGGGCARLEDRVSTCWRVLVLFFLHCVVLCFAAHTALQMQCSFFNGMWTCTGSAQLEDHISV